MDDKFIIADGVLEEYLGNDLDVIVPDGTSSIADSVFKNKDMIETITLPNSLVKIGNYAFSNCRNLRSVIFGKNPKLKEIGGCAFIDCKSISILVLPMSLRLIERNAFYGCSSLTKVSFSFSGESLEYPGDLEIEDSAFGNCEKLELFDFNAPIKRIGNIFPNSTGLTKVLFGNSSVEVINNFAFANQRLLDEVILPDSLKVIGPNAFAGCKKLSIVKLPEGLERIEQSAFNNCTKLRVIDLNKNLKYIGPKAFETCLSLRYVDIPDGISSLEERAFAICDALEKVSLSNNVNDIHSQAFRGCKDIKEITYRGSKEEWDKLELDNVFSASKDYKVIFEK